MATDVHSGARVARVCWMFSRSWTPVSQAQSGVRDFQAVQAAVECSS